MAFSASATIDRSPEEVWAFMTDWSHAPSWMPGIESMRRKGDEPDRVGTELIFDARGAERSSEITAWDPPRGFTLRSTQGGVTAQYVYRLEPAADGGSIVKLIAGCEARGAWKLLGPLISVLMARSDRVQPARLKAAIEG